MSIHQNPNTLRFQVPRVFAPLLGQARYKGAHGGRGSGKSHFFANLLIDDHMRYPGMRSVCIREIQKSLEYSVMQLLADKIREHQLQQHFNIRANDIQTPGGGHIIFQGMQNHTADSIKSLEGYRRAWFEEAHNASKKSLKLLRPTMRAPGSQMWFSWNPEKSDAPIEELLRGEFAMPDSLVVEGNYWDNPWFPDELRGDMLYDKRRDLDAYLHVWCGKFLTNSEGRVFQNWTVRDFEVPADAMLLHGADWGFSIDPTVLVRGFVGSWGDDGEPFSDPNGKTLFISHERYKIGLELDHTPEYWDALDHLDNGSAREWEIVADSSNPQAISYLQRHGYPRVLGAKKGPNSIKEGIKFLQSYDIVVHPRCKHTEQELTYFSYKTDPKTLRITPVLMQTKNHVIDSLRYMVEPIRFPYAKTLVGSY